MKRRLTVAEQIDKYGEYLPEPVSRIGRREPCEHCSLERVLRRDGLCRECAHLLGVRR